MLSSNGANKRCVSWKIFFSNLKSCTSLEKLLSINIAESGLSALQKKTSFNSSLFLEKIAKTVIESMDDVIGGINYSINCQKWLKI